MIRPDSVATDSATDIFVFGPRMFENMEAELEIFLRMENELEIFLISGTMLLSLDL